MKPLKLGIIGTGSVVREIYQYLYFNSDYSEYISVESICDINEENVNSFGEAHGVPQAKRYTDYVSMCSETQLDAVAVNTPDGYHAAPILHAFDLGLDVFVPKPLADTLGDAYAVMRKLESSGRFMGVDFHKREDPRIKEAKARYQNGDYGTIQSSVWYMIDRLMVADPNHEPRFFATDDFAVKNTPVSFLTVHMADAFMFITGLRPLEIRATGYKQKLAALSPISVDGYDLVDTEVLFEGGSLVHFITGWALPNTAHATTVQSARIIGRDGLLDLNLDQPGYHEILDDGIFERNPLFRNFESDGSVSGYGMTSPGRIFRNITRFRDGGFSPEQLEELHSPFSLGFYTTAVCEAAHESLANGVEIDGGVIRGTSIHVSELLRDRIGTESV
ncbi:MAG: Gfo/Idh/MocA family oxidoreductase [Spirochaetales bacterium]|jgi:predicted dehydrogenase|nr:Gfo/Idh/MocA family oxidoreductase [Spirochaetales bacterium]